MRSDLRSTPTSARSSGYGGPAGLALVEAVFCADSPAVADMLAFVRGQTALDRLSALAVGIDSLLADLGLSTAERHAWYKKHATERHAGGPEFRERKAQLRSSLGQSTALAQAHPEFARIMASRQRALIPLGRRFSELASQRELQDRREGILRSVVHMHCNRFVGSERSLEDKALGLLSRLHQSLKEAPVARIEADELRANAPDRRQNGRRSRSKASHRDAVKSRRRLYARRTVLARSASALHDIFEDLRRLSIRLFTIRSLSYGRFCWVCSGWFLAHNKMVCL